MTVKQWFEKIVFKNNSLPAINSTNLNNIQDLINKAIDDAYNEAISKGLPLASVLEYYGTEAPENYLFANGQAISRTDYSELFEIIGETYGAGNGETTFNLPDRRERVGVGLNPNSEYEMNVLGKTGGEFEHTLLISEMPEHDHTAKTATINASSGSVSVMRNNNYNDFGDGDAPPHTAKTGGGQAHNNIQPYIVCNYIIKVK